MKEDAAETGFQNGSGQIGGEKLYVPASVIPLGSGLDGRLQNSSICTQADPRGSGHGLEISRGSSPPKHRKPTTDPDADHAALMRIESKGAPCDS